MKLTRFFLTAILVCIPITLTHAESLNVGDYIEYGTYQSTPLVWRCVDSDADSITLLSDKILFTSSFDEASNNWSTSTLRTYLNDPSGFLTDFTSAEKSMLLPSTLSYACNYAYDTDNPVSNYTTTEQEVINKYKLNPSNTSAVKAHVNAEPMAQWLSSYQPYSQTLDQSMSKSYRSCASYDSIYLPSVSDLSYLTNDAFTYVGTTATCSCDVYTALSQSYPKLPENASWCYWLRDALSFSTAPYQQYVSRDGSIQCSLVSNGNIGVRPMCRITTDFDISKGTGTASNPFVIKGSAMYTTLESILSADFEDSGKYGFNWYSAGSGTISVEYTDADHLHSAKMVTPTSGSVPYFATKSLSDQGGLMLFECEYKFLDYNMDCAVLSTKTQPSSKWINAIRVKGDGKSATISLGALASGAREVSSVELGKWYKFTAIVDSNSKLITVLINDELICSNEPMNVDFDTYDYVRISQVSATTTGKNTVYVDNVRIERIARRNYPCIFKLGTEVYVEGLLSNNAVLYVAYYDDAGRLARVERISDVGTISNSITATDSKVCAFVWDEASDEPLSFMSVLDKN